MNKLNHPVRGLAEISVLVHDLIEYKSDDEGIR